MFDRIDLWIRNLAAAGPLYDALSPAMGCTKINADAESARHHESPRCGSNSSDISAERRPATTGKKKLITAIFLSMCLAAACLLSLNARAQDAPAQDVRQYTDGPVIEEDFIEVEYGRFEQYVDWLNSTWKPTMEALKKAGLITDYHVFTATPNSPGQPNVILWIAFKNGMAALDKGAEIEDVAKKVICSTECQNKARVFRNQYRKVLGTQLIREIILH